MRPAIEALASEFRVITFPLCGERASGRRFDPVRGFDNYVSQLDAVLDHCGTPRAVICGVSFGGLIALHYAAERPTRSAALILSSTPGPTFHLTRRQQLYAKAPLAFAPFILAELPARMRKELSVALTPGARVRFRMWQVGTYLGAPVSVSKMAERSKLLGDPALRHDCGRISAPTLILTGEPALDDIVPVGGTSEYAALIAGAQSARIEGTGHLGYLTRPGRFVAIVRQFLRERAHAAA
jgi:pimeloyl-ACP methyl ester carboxylesterase